MANELTTSDVRRNVAKDDGGNTGNGNLSRGDTRSNLSLRNEQEVPDEALRKEIAKSKREVASELGGVSFQNNKEARDAARYLTFLRVSLGLQDREKPSSVSHARRYSYDNQQEKFWRDRLIRAIQNA